MGKRKYSLISRSEWEEAAAWPDNENIRAFRSYLENYHGDSIEALLLAEDVDCHYSIEVEYADFLNACSALGNLLPFEPIKFLPLFDDGARQAQIAALAAHVHKESMKLKENVHVRLNVHGSAFQCPETGPTIGRVRVRDVGHLLTLRGTIIRSGLAQLIEGGLQYACTTCKHRFKLDPQLEMGNTIQPPSTCPSRGRPPCLGTKFELVEGALSVCHDYQEIKIQEGMRTERMNLMPRSMTIVLEDDLVDTVKAGDEIMVTGVLYNKWKPPIPDARCDLEMMLLANHIRQVNERKLATLVSPRMAEQFEDFWRRYTDTPFAGRNTILENVCPQLCGLFAVKLAVVLTLIGGVGRVDASGTRIRGESHLLLVGDPGTGKSQFLKYAAELSHRSVVTTGMGSTGAGLTVAAVKEAGGWTLEAGALVLADGGLCCIDEFNRIRESDKATIHEAMEQQTVSVAKAGMVTTLNTRTTVFGAVNPKGCYDAAKPLTQNTSLSAPLLSRFDVVLVLLDTKCVEWDKTLSSHLLSEHWSAGESNGSSSTGVDAWNIDTLQSYIRYVRARFKPTLTSEADEVISSYYRLQRRSDSLQLGRTTIRMLESLIRLAQAHARLMFRGEVLRADAVAAVVCIESSTSTPTILDGMGNALHSGFVDNPDMECILRSP